MNLNRIVNVREWPRGNEKGIVLSYQHSSDASMSIMLLCVHEKHVSSGYTNSIEWLYVSIMCMMRVHQLHNLYMCMRNQDKDINIPLTPCYDLNYLTFIVLLLPCAYILCGLQFTFERYLLCLKFTKQSNAKLFLNNFKIVKKTL